MRASRWLMVALFIVSAVVVVEAQQPRGGGGFGAINVVNAVVSNKDLQAELKCTDAQKDKFKEPAEKLAALNKKRTSAFKDAAGDKDKLKETMADLQKETEKVDQEVKKMVADALTPDQMKRLKQIEYQAKGLRAFTDEAVVKELNITEAQTTKIKGIMEEFNKDSKDLGFGGGGKGGKGGKGGGGGFDKEKAAENQKKREKLTKAAEADIVDILTADQKKQWKEMTGEPFDTAKLRTAGGGFGGGGGNFGKGKNKTKDE